MMREALCMFALTAGLVLATGCSDPARATALDAGGGVDGTLASGCPVRGYSACGGDLLGTWHFVSLCPEDQAKADALFEHPFDNAEACQDRTLNHVRGTWVREGTMTFTATDVGMKLTSKAEVSYGFTDACLAVASPFGATPADACAALTKPDRLTCSYAPGLCTCVGSVPAPDEDSKGSYLVSDGNMLTLNSGEMATFCAAGDQLILDWAQHPVSWRYWILKR